MARDLYKELQNEWSESYCKLYSLCNSQVPCSTVTTSNVTASSS